MIAMALACHPKILIADEPTTALDVTVQAQIFNLLRAIQEKTRTAIIYITHDMGSIAEMAHRVIVMYAGHKVEDGPVDQILRHPRHPYTQGLIVCVPHLEEKPSPERPPLCEIPGVVPSPLRRPQGCLFAPRCGFAQPQCQQEMPPVHNDGHGHATACWLLVEDEETPHIKRGADHCKPPRVETIQPRAESRCAEVEPLLRVKDLVIHFHHRRRSLWGKRSTVHAVDGVSFKIHRGQALGLVGESGSGKTTTALGVLRLVPITSGQVVLGEEDITHLQGEALRRARKKVQIIFQDPYSSLNPYQRVGAIVREPMDLLEIGACQDREERVRQLFASVGLRPEQLAYFPHQFSGGQRQRIGVARALASRPDLIVCDEPVSALDVAIQAQILNILRQLQAEFNLTYLFISHDLGVVQYICDEIAVMYLGQIVEHADRISLFKHPLHPYTWALLSAVPSAQPGAAKNRKRIQLQGDTPSPIDPPPGCRFANRCPFAGARTEVCWIETPQLRIICLEHRVACHRVTEQGDAPQYA